METADLKTILGVLCSVIEAEEKARADGKIDMSDIAYVMPLVMQIGPAISAAPKAFAQFKAASLEDRTKLIADVSADFAIENKALEAKIEAGLAALVHLGAFLG